MSPPTAVWGACVTAADRCSPVARPGSDASRCHTSDTETGTENAINIVALRPAETEVLALRPAETFSLKTETETKLSRPRPKF